MTREESRLGPSQRACSQRLRDSSTTPRWLKSSYHQPSLICSTLPEDALLWPLQRQDGQCLIHIEAAVLDRLRAMRKLGEMYSDAIVWLVEMGGVRPIGRLGLIAVAALGSACVSAQPLYCSR